MLYQAKLYRKLIYQLSSFSVVSTGNDTFGLSIGFFRFVSNGDRVPRCCVLRGSYRATVEDSDDWFIGSGRCVGNVWFENLKLLILTLWWVPQKLSNERYQVNVGLSNGFMPSDNKPLIEAVLTQSSERDLGVCSYDTVLLVEKNPLQKYKPI